MKKSILLVLGVCSALFSQAQVGVDTENPKATLDVVASPTVSTKVDGLIAPRLTGDQLKAKDALYTADQLGAIVYAKSAATPTTAKTINVTDEGYYYFDGTVWVKMGAGAGGAYQEPWYNAADNQPATENTQDIYQMGRIGIKTDSPNAALHILSDNGNGYDDDIWIESYGTDNAALNYMRARGTKDAPSQLQEWDALGSFFFRSYVGGTFVPSSSLIAHYRGDGTNNRSSFLFRTSSLNSVVIDPEGYLGVGRTSTVMTPVTGLDVRGSARTGTPHADEISGTSAIGLNSIAVGVNNLVSGRFSSSFGANTVSDDYSVAFGRLNKVLGNHSSAFGGESTVSGLYSTSFGRGNNVSGHFSSAFGFESEINGYVASAFGDNLIVPSRSETVIGMYNEIVTGNAEVRMPQDPVLQVGIGTGDSNRKNALTIYKNGNVQLSNIPVYANDAAADADTALPSGSLYKTTTGGRAVFQKP